MLCLPLLVLFYIEDICRFLMNNVFISSREAEENILHECVARVLNMFSSASQDDIQGIFNTFLNVLQLCLPERFSGGVNRSIVVAILVKSIGQWKITQCPLIFFGVIFFTQ